MTFTNEELSAIYRLAQAMAQADGKVAKEEIAIIILELQRFGVDQNKAKIIIEMSEKMSYSEACQIVSRMIPSEKRYVTAYLGALICADGNIDDSEMKLWSLITAICDLPEMNIFEALDIMAKL